MNDINILFFKVWRNNYLKFMILELIRNDKARARKKINNTKEFKTFRGHEYLKSIFLNSKLPFIKGYSLSNSNITSLILGGKFNSDIEVGDIPYGVINLTIIGYQFNKKILPGIIPSTVKVLKMKCRELYNQPFILKSIPESVTELELPDKFNLPIEKGVLPNGLTKLTFGYLFNTPLNGCVPSSVKILEFSGHRPEFQIGDIPNSVTELNLGYYIYSLPKPDLIPFSVTKLVVCGSFPKPLEPGCIPSSVTSLSIIDQNKNYEIPEGVIPPSVTDLTYGALLGKSSIPNSVTKLNFSYSSTGSLKNGHIPDSVTILSLSNQFYSFEIGYILPTSITSIAFSYYNQSLSPISHLSSLTELKYYGNIEKDLNESIKILHCDINKIKPKSTNPLVFKSITSLKLKNSSSSIPPIKAPLLKHLEFENFKRSIKQNDIPSTVTTLILPNYHNLISSNNIPQSVTELTLPSSYNQNINIFKELPSIKSLKFI